MWRKSIQSSVQNLQIQVALTVRDQKLQWRILFSYFVRRIVWSVVDVETFGFSIIDQIVDFPQVLR